MQTTAVVLSILYLVATPIKSSAASCSRSDDEQQDNVVWMKTDPTTRLVSPAKPGSNSYSDFCGESRHRRDVDNATSDGVVRKKRSVDTGIVHVSDCYEEIYPTMCDYNPNRIPSEIQMVDCGKCGSNENRSRPLARCIKYIKGKAVYGDWKPIMMTISLPFNTSTNNIYQLQHQQIPYACYCKTTE